MDLQMESQCSGRQWQSKGTLTFTLSFTSDLEDNGNGPAGTPLKEQNYFSVISMNLAL